jgi:hypothetical protein
MLVFTILLVALLFVVLLVRIHYYGKCLNLKSPEISFSVLWTFFSFKYAERNDGEGIIKYKKKANVFLCLLYAVLVLVFISVAYV